MLPLFVVAPIIIGVLLYLFTDTIPESPQENPGAAGPNPWLKRAFSKILAGRIAAIIAQAIFTCFTFYLFWAAGYGTIITVVGDYRQTLGITLRADSLAAVFVMLTALLFLAAAVYGLKESGSKLYWLLMFIWEGLIIGVFLARDLFNLFVMLEVATLVVAILIMFIREKRSMFDGLIFLMINTVAMQFYLFGVGYVYMLTGTLDIDRAAQFIAELAPAQLILPYTLIMTALIFKCAVMPLASWLPKVQGIPRAPSAVSAILSALHVKCALFMFIRLQEMFAPIAVNALFLAVGISTAVMAIIMAYAQRDIKLILAYSSTAQIGLIMAGLNIGGVYSVEGSLFHIINHAVFKAALFFSAGMLVRMYGTRDITKIRGLFRRSPVLGTATLFAILGIAGAPFFGGSLSKYLLTAQVSAPLYWLVTLINLGTVALFVKYSAMLFGKDTGIGAPELSITKNKHITVSAFGIMSLGLGLFGSWLVEFLFGSRIIFTARNYLEIAAIFGVSVLVGVLLYRLSGRFGKYFDGMQGLNLNFRGMCVSIGLFFGVMLVVMGSFQSLHPR